MTETEFDTEFEIILSKPPKCESKHGVGNIPECSGNAVALYACVCAAPATILVCQNAADYAASKIADPARLCGTCKMPCNQCWTVAPLP